MSTLVIELLHNLTKTYDFYGLKEEPILVLTKEAFEELDNSIFISPGGVENKNGQKTLSIDGYTFSITICGQPF